VSSRKANPEYSGPRVLRDFPSGAPTRKKSKKKRTGGGGAFLAFLLAVLFQAALLSLAVRVLHSAGAVTWSLSLWESVALSALYLVWRTFYSYVFARMDDSQ
jgi:hypothetical protein